MHSMRALPTPPPPPRLTRVLHHCKKCGHFFLLWGEVHGYAIVEQLHAVGLVLRREEDPMVDEGLPAELHQQEGRRGRRDFK